MDPVTALSLASMTYSLLGPKGEDPMSAVLKMIEAINEKLNIINEKLDIIIGAIIEIPDKVEYERQVQNLKSSTWHAKLLYQNYISDITIDAEKGKQTFIENKKDEVEGQLTRLRDSFNYLSDFKDLTSINFCCIAIALDNELTKLISENKNYVIDVNKIYFKYLKSTLYENEFEKKIKEIQGALFKIMNTEWVVYHKHYKQWRIRGGSRGSYSSHTIKFLRAIKHKGKFISSPQSNKEKEIGLLLYQNGHIESPIDCFYSYDSFSLTGLSGVHWDSPRISPYYETGYGHGNNSPDGNDVNHEFGKAEPEYIRDYMKGFKKSLEIQYDLIAHYSTKDLLINRLLEVNQITGYNI